MRVLVVDDDASLRALWKTVFEMAGHEATCASSACAARRDLLERSYDLVLLDLFLGDDSGLSVATAAAYANPNCRVIVVTGSALFPHGELFTIAPSVSAVLRKPVSIDDLLAVSEHEVAAPQRQALSA